MIKSYKLVLFFNLDFFPAHSTYISLAVNIVQLDLFSGELRTRMLKIIPNILTDLYF